MIWPAYTHNLSRVDYDVHQDGPQGGGSVEKFTRGLPDNIQGNVIAAEPTRLQDAVRIVNNLIDPKVEGNVGGQNVARAYTAGNNEKRGYAGPLPYCSKCKLHHEGPCTVKCGKCNKVGHMARDYKNAVVVPTTQRAPVVNQRVPTCFECGRHRHYRNECPKLKNQNRGNKVRKKTKEARGKAYVMGGGEANPDSNVFTGTFLLNNHCASMLFDSGADRSFVSTTFSTLLDITPDTLDVSYAVELDDERISENNTVLRGCTLGLLGHPFNIDLMPVQLGSFDVIIGMDWLANHHAVIACDENIVWIPYGDEVLIVQGDRSEKGKKSKLSIISCTKTQKYIKRGCLIFLAQITKKETENKSKENQLEDVPIVQEFPEVFPKDFPGLPPAISLNLPVQILNAQVESRREENYETKDLGGMIKNLEPRADGTLCLKNRSWIPCFGNLRTLIMHESHKSKYSIHPRSDKMYPGGGGKDLKKPILVPNMKAEIATYTLVTVSELVKELRPNAKNHLVVGSTYDPSMKWENITMDFVTKLANMSSGQDQFGYHTSIKAALFKALYGRKCRLPVCWAEVGDAQLTSPEIIHETTERIIQINKRIQAARDRQKSYADRRRKLLEFEVGDKVMLKCFSDEPLAIPLDEIQIDDKLNFIEEPVEIMDRDVKRLKQSRIPIVKVRWNSRQGTKFT
ncbi:putative reverse transcriptase domain-containing protein [Tanacetum coccineum]|uniref:Reverse transcriptase domain-containing protein n=1 Tax=Tanacetum coccineum TaxID=301880 RepID=A0ABQ4WC42_9ASTR